MNIILTDNRLDSNALDILFREARTYNDWTDEPINPQELRSLVNLVKMAPTSANCLPARFVFTTTPDAKAKLKPFLAEGNVEKTMAAPVTAIIGYDKAFYNRLPEFFPHADAKSWYVGNDAFAKQAAELNSSLQVGYFILAARALGLDAGPMTGFDADGASKAFFPDGDVQATVLVNLGHGKADSLFPRSPRPSFDSIASIE